MKVITTRDFEEIPQGSVLQNVKRKKDGWYGLWCSRLGSWHVTVPYEVAEPYDEKNDPIMKLIESAVANLA